MVQKTTREIRAIYLVRAVLLKTRRRDQCFHADETLPFRELS
jgi:hypothetical protein